MCDDSGTIYAGDDGEVVVDLGDVVLGMDDLDEQTKRELLANGFFDSTKLPDPGCKWCRGTGKVKLLVSETECDCVR